MSRMSRGCLQCRSRKVKCDEGRPSCRRCVQRGELCTGYRDEATLLFRYENEKVERKVVRRRASDLSSMSSKASSQSAISPGSLQDYSPMDNSSEDLTAGTSGLNLPRPYPWLKNVNEASVPSVEDQAVSEFFEKFVMYPCNLKSSPGFLEHLPGMFHEVSIENRTALRWAVRAAAYANLSRDQSDVAMGDKAMQCYGLALSALSKSLKGNNAAPDDYILMAVVVLDLFETMYLGDSRSVGSHAEGMKQILRLRGNEQMYGARGWSLFRLSHHRVQRQQLAFKQDPMPESKTWLYSLNDELPDVQIEKQNFEIAEICQRARQLLERIGDVELPADHIFSIIREMHGLDQTAITWRKGSNWSFRTITRSEISPQNEMAADFPGSVQLHRDVWIAYEWNYHRTARIILHEQLLQCLDRALPGSEEDFGAELDLLRQASISIIRNLVDEILSTVPQSLGDIDDEGKLLRSSAETSKCAGIGGYFLLWPIKVIKGTKSATAEQRESGQTVFERIREVTGMKSKLGELSCI